MTCPTTLWLATIGDVTHLVRPDPLTALVRQPRLVGGLLEVIWRRRLRRLKLLMKKLMILQFLQCLMH